MASMTDTVWHGATELADSLTPIDSLHTHPGNPRRGDIESIAQSLTRFGQVRAVLTTPEGEIIAGNHTYLAAVSLGWTHIATVANEFASPQEARAYLLADNRIGDLGEYDRVEQRALLEELEQSGVWAGTGYSPEDLDHMRQLEEMQNAPPPEPPPAAATPQAPPGLREVVLMFDDDQHAEFGNNVRVLRDHFHLEGVTETVLAAVKAEAFRLNQGEPDA